MNLDQRYAVGAKFHTMPYLWKLTIGDMCFYSRHQYHWWQRFCLRLLGWRVERVDE
ncbi:hypothetical protein [Bowmanella sp. JS7-9]|uniref:Uncharacterized protein n=1 Tax=Pseudobowmanella zhangzhouensis TaxID=1537679 RepID=A0ABW1XMC7_9ALTE|nr:hypothetical protein [Bowmanella sp. JS7-9]